MWSKRFILCFAYRPNKVLKCNMVANSLHHCVLFMGSPVLAYPGLVLLRPRAGVALWILFNTPCNGHDFKTHHLRNQSAHSFPSSSLAGVFIPPIRGIGWTRCTRSGSPQALLSYGGSIEAGKLTLPPSASGIFSPPLADDCGDPGEAEHPLMCLSVLHPFWVHWMRFLIFFI